MKVSCHNEAHTHGKKEGMCRIFLWQRPPVIESAIACG